MMTRLFTDTDFGLDPEPDEAAVTQGEIVERAIARFAADLRQIEQGNYVRPVSDKSPMPAQRAPEPIA